MTRYARRYVKRLLLIEKFWEGEHEIRKKFQMPDNKPCVDMIAHFQHCPYLVIEEKSSSDILHAINQLEVTVDHLTSQGYNITECVIIVESLRKFKSFERDKDHKLRIKIGKKRKKPIKINSTIKIKVIYKSDLMKKR